MKKIFDLKIKLKSPNKRSTEDQVPMFQDIVIDSLMHMPPKNGVDSIKNFRLAEKILENDMDLIEVEDSEFERIVEAVDKNPCGYLSWTLGQMLIKIQEWTK